MMLGNMGRELIDIITFYMRKAAATGTLQMKMMTAAIGKPKAGATVALVFLGNALAAKLFKISIYCCKPYRFAARLNFGKNLLGGDMLALMKR